MRLGVALPQFGDLAGPDAIRTAAERAEALGFDSLWTADRLLYPIEPKTPYPGTEDGSLPGGCRRLLDPIGALTFAAAYTKRVRLGTSVLNLPYYNPVVLARELTTVDVLSGGRLSIGFGTGWSQDEFDAAGVDMKTRGSRANEALTVLEKYWADEPQAHQGKHFTLAKSLLMKPVQRPRPRLYMAGFNAVTMKRVAERTDGWNPAGLPIPVMKQMWDAILGMASAAGRKPESLELVVRANVTITPKPLPEKKYAFVGSMEQIKEDIIATREAGAHELFFDFQLSGAMKSMSEYTEMLHRFWELAH